MEMILDVFKWSIIAGAATLLLTLLKPAFEKRYSARWRYWTWLVIAVLSLLAPIQWEKLLPAAPQVQTPVVIDVPNVAVQVSRGDGIQVSVQPAPLPAAPQGRTWKTDDVLPVLWLSGMALFVLYHLFGNLLFRHKVRRWRCPPGGGAVRLYETVCQEMGLKNAPPLWVSSAVASPMLLGLLRPCLLLPGEGWRERELSFILRHELTHFRRRDLAYKCILLAANAVHWFNPFFYLLIREADADIELTCDDAVVAGADRETRRAYSETLLSAVHREKSAALSTHFYGGKQVMKERFRNILGSRGRKWGVFVLTLTLLATAVTACTVGFQQAENESASQDAEIEAVPDGIPEPLNDKMADLVPLPEKWPTTSTDFLASLRDGHETWALDWEDAALTYLTSIRKAPADGPVQTVESHDESRLVSIPSGQRTACMLLVQTASPIADRAAEVTFWQVSAFCWRDSAPEIDVTPLTAAELAEFADYFNHPFRNGLLRFSYERVSDIPPYLELLFYDAGEPVTDEAEYRAAADLYGGELETDCTKLTTEFILSALNTYFVSDFPFDREWLTQALDVQWNAFYLPEYDAYYIVHGDTNMVSVTFSAGQRGADGRITLYYTGDIWSYSSDGALQIAFGQPMQVVLQSSGRNSWQVVQNARIESLPE